MASPQQRPDPRTDSGQRRPDDLGYSRVQGQIGKGRPFAWWWIVVLVIIALVVWWGGWGHSTHNGARNQAPPIVGTPATNNQRTANGSAIDGATATTNNGQNAAPGAAAGTNNTAPESRSNPSNGSAGQTNGQTNQAPR